MSAKASPFVYFMIKVNDKPSQEIYSVLRNFLLSVNDKFLEPFRRCLEFMGYERNMTWAMQEQTPTSSVRINSSTLSDITNCPWPLTLPRLQTFGSTTHQRSTSTSEKLPRSAFTDDLSWSKSALDEILHVGRKTAVKAVLEADRGEFIKNVGDKLHKDNVDTFKNCSVDMVTNFDIPLRTYQTLLRSSTSEEIKKIVGYNPFVSKAEIESNLQLRYKSLSEKLGLDFIEGQGTVAGVVDIRKTLTWYLSSE